VIDKVLNIIISIMFENNKISITWEQ